MQWLPRFPLMVLSLLGLTLSALGQDPLGQPNGSGFPVAPDPITRNVLGFTPSHAERINGLALGFATSAAGLRNGDLVISGVNIEMNPIALIGLPYILVGGLISPINMEDSIGSSGANIPERGHALYPGPRETGDATVNGLNISTMYAGNLKGLGLSALLSTGGRASGLIVSGGMNAFYQFSGISIAGLQNKAAKGTGLQLALFNQCLDCKGVQIGLLNRMGHRTLPFVNVRL